MRRNKSLLFIVFGFGLLLVFAVAVLLALHVRHVLRSRDSPARLGAGMGWRRVGTGGPAWFEGPFEGRRAAVLSYGRVTRSSDGPSVEPTLRVAMEVRRPFAGVVLAGTDTTSFESCFRGAVSVVPEAARPVMLAFAAGLIPAGVSSAGISLSPRKRHLMLSSRTAMPDSGVRMPETVLSGAPTVVVHDYPNPDIEVEAFRSILAELAAIAAALESSL